MRSAFRGPQLKHSCAKWTVACPIKKRAESLHGLSIDENSSNRFYRVCYPQSLYGKYNYGVDKPIFLARFGPPDRQK